MGFSFSGNHYVPRLLWKRGEQKALGQLTPATKAGLTPLIELEVAGAKGVQAHVDAAATALASSWGTADPVLLDPRRVQGGYAAAVAAVHKAGVSAIPVIHMGTSAADVASAVASGGPNGIALRIHPHELALPPMTAWSTITASLQAIGVKPADVHLLLDFEGLAQQGAGLVLRIAWNAILAPGGVPSFRSFTVLASAFPASLAALKNASTIYPRHEWSDWLLMHGARAQLPFLPTFGDYGIQNPAPPPAFQPGMVVIPVARYTTGADWLIARGLNPKTSKKLPSGQFTAIAQHLARHASFAGAGHCAGCDDVIRCSGGAPKLGSNEGWRRIGTVHHLTSVVAQLAALPWP